MLIYLFRQSDRTVIELNTLRDESERSSPSSHDDDAGPLPPTDGQFTMTELLSTKK